MNNAVASLEGHPAGLCTLGLIEKQKGKTDNLTKTVYCSPYSLCQVISSHIWAARLRNRSVSLVSSRSLSGENHLQLVNAFEQVRHKMTDKNALCSLHPSLARNINASGPKNRADVNLKWSKYQSINQPNKCPFLSNEWGGRGNLNTDDADIRMPTILCQSKREENKTLELLFHNNSICDNVERVVGSELCDHIYS